MIPDDAVLVVRTEAVSVREAECEPCMVVFMAEMGFPGMFDASALAHVYRRDNPHEDCVWNVCVPAGFGGMWFKLGSSAVVVTDEEPLYAEDVHPVVSEDGLVRTDGAGANCTLAGCAAFPLRSAGVLRLFGDDRFGPRMFYGTDAAGTAGFNLVPGEQVIP